MFASQPCKSALEKAIVSLLVHVFMLIMNIMKVIIIIILRWVRHCNTKKNKSNVLNKTIVINAFYILPLLPLGWIYEFGKAWKLKPFFSVHQLFIPLCRVTGEFTCGLYPLKLDSQLWAITIRPVGPTVYSLSPSHPHCATPFRILVWLGRNPQERESMLWEAGLNVPQQLSWLIWSITLQ